MQNEILLFLAVVKSRIVNCSPKLNSCVSMFCFIIFWIASFLAMTTIYFRRCEERSNPEGVCNAKFNYNLNFF